jgi:hypothetical protein
MLDSYMLKTDRDRQWSQIENRFVENGNTRKNIKICKNYFFDGIDKNATFRWKDRLVFYPNPTMDGWQKLFDEEITDPLTDQDFFTLQLYLCGQLYEYYFDAEDQSYYFKTAFGERYDENKTFPIKINRESEHRKITLTPNKILRHLMTYFSRYMEDIKVDYAGFLRFNLGYLDSLLPLVSKEFFSTQRYQAGDETEDRVRLGAVQSATTKMLKWSYAKPSKKIDQERIDAANSVKEVFLKHADNLGEFNALHDKIRKELKIKD